MNRRTFLKLASLFPVAAGAVLEVLRHAEVLSPQWYSHHHDFGSLSDIDRTLKEVYQEPIREQLRQSSVLWRHLQEYKRKTG